jgi:hypothetical protein
MRVVTIHHAKTNLSRLIEKASEGEEVIIARGSKPVGSRGRDHHLRHWTARSVPQRPISQLGRSLVADVRPPATLPARSDVVS